MIFEAFLGVEEWIGVPREAVGDEDSARINQKMGPLAVQKTGQDTSHERLRRGRIHDCV